MPTSQTSATLPGNVHNSSGGFKRVRISKFRHVYGTGARKDQCYEGIRISSSAHDAQLCALNPKFLAVALEVAGGGAFQVIPLEWTGRVDYHSGRVSGHNGPVTDLKWDPFNDNVIASSSDDCTVKLWYIEDGGIKTFVSDWLCELRGHTRKVAYIEWHPTVQDMIASASHDHMVLLWNVRTAECLTSIDAHQDVIYSLSFSLMGNWIATTCKDKRLRLFDSRTGECTRDVVCHEGSKPSKCICVTKLGYILTTGFSKTSSRQVSLWDQENFAKPLTVIEVDYSSGVLFPFLDADLNMVYIAGKGDGNIRYYEVTKQSPFMHYLSEYRSAQPQRGFGVLPKRALKLNQCEVFRMYKLHATQCLVAPVSFVVPRKSEMFQSDLYPPTASPTPALTIQEWFMGMDRSPVTMYLQMRMTVAPVTCKPVRVSKGLLADSCDSISDHKPVLITSDPNNDRKFQFLSQITRADYREVTQREDYPQILQEKQLRQRAASPEVARNGRKPVACSAGDVSEKEDSSVRSDPGPAIIPAGPGSSETLDSDSPSHHMKPDGAGDGPPSSAALRNGNNDCKMALLRNSELSTSSEVGEFTGRKSDVAARAYDSNPATPISGEMGLSSSGFRHRNTTDATTAGAKPLHTRSESPKTSISNGSKPMTGAPTASLGQAHAKPDKPPTPATRSVLSNLSSPHSRHVHSSSSNGVASHHSPFMNLTRGYTFTSGFQSKQSPSTNTKPGRIGPAPILPQTQTAHVRPFQVTPKGSTKPPIAGVSGSPTRAIAVGRQSVDRTVQSPSIAAGLAGRHEGRSSSIDIPNSHSIGSIYAEPLTNGAGLPNCSDLGVSGSRGADATSSVASWSESPSKRESELQKLYAAQCKQVRSLLEDRAAKEARIQLLEEDTAKKATNSDRLAQNLEHKLEEIECLRHEIAWKDARIEELQNQLYRVAALVPDNSLSQLKDSE